MAIFRAAGDSILTATLKQGLTADPLDKMVTSFVVFVLIVSLSRRFIARFPNGERLLPGGSDAAGSQPWGRPA